jgi:hypothetical protein
LAKNDTNWYKNDTKQYKNRNITLKTTKMKSKSQKTAKTEKKKHQKTKKIYKKNSKPAQNSLKPSIFFTLHIPKYDFRHNLLTTYPQIIARKHGNPRFTLSEPQARRFERFHDLPFPNPKLCVLLGLRIRLKRPRIDAKPR